MLWGSLDAAACIKPKAIAADRDSWWCLAHFDRAFPDRERVRVLRSKPDHPLLVDWGTQELTAWYRGSGRAGLRDSLTVKTELDVTESRMALDHRPRYRMYISARWYRGWDVTDMQVVTVAGQYGERILGASTEYEMQLTRRHLPRIVEEGKQLVSRCARGHGRSGGSVQFNVDTLEIYPGCR